MGRDLETAFQQGRHRRGTHVIQRLADQGCFLRYGNPILVSNYWRIKSAVVATLEWTPKCM